MSDIQTTSTKNARRRKIQAVLAGGAVLGLGAAVTLAQWSDEIFAGADFETGTFALEASTEGPGPGSDWASGGSEDDPTVEFAFAPDSVVPGGTDYQDLYIRLTSGSDLAGALDGVDLTLADDDGNAANIEYELFLLTGEDTCSGTPSDTSLATGTLASENSAGLDIDLDASGSAGGGNNEAVNLCFAFDYDEDDLEQGSSTSAVWEFSATSEDS